MVRKRKIITETNNERNKDRMKGIINKRGDDKGKEIIFCTPRKHKKK